MRRCQFAVDDAREASRKLYAATTDADDLRKLDAVKRVMEIDEDITDAIVVYQRATGKTL
jgi:hypothetical protein